MKQDTVAWSRELLSVKEISDHVEASPHETGDSRWPLAVPVPVSDDGVEIAFEPGTDDWQGADQVVVPLFVPPGVEAFSRIRIDCASDTPGLHGHDYMRCYYRYLHEGWGRLEFPYENMLIFGIPDDWHQVSRVELVLRGEGEGEFQIGAIAIEKRDRVEGPRLTDEELFAELDLGRAGLESVRQFVETGELERAKRALVEYYRGRKSPRHPFPTEPSPRPDYDRREADVICEHYILDQQLGQEIDWRANPIGYLEWMHAFNRQHFIPTLVDGYLATGDKKYARELDYLISSWIRANPVPLTNNGGGDPAWETLSTACRVNNVWPPLWAALQGSPYFRLETRIDMLKSLYAHAEHLKKYPTGNNWLVAESNAVATVGILFPEFKKAGEWREVGLGRLEREMKHQVYPDGAQFELSPGYHRMCANLFAKAFELATLNGYSMSRQFVSRLEAMVAYSMHITRPDGSRPSLNDAGSLDQSTEPELLRGHELFDRKDFLFVATSGREGEAPSSLSKAFPYAGHYVMRTGWGDDALWALIDAGPFGTGHQHEDKLSLELYAYDTRFIVDPGIASYLDDPWTHYSRSTAAHNTVLVDGQGQSRATNVPPERYRVEEPEEALWGSSEYLDILWASYEDGYHNLEEELTHKRLVLFVKPSFWVVWDVLGGRGTHEMDIPYHFAPMLVQPDEGIVRSNRLGLPNIELLSLGSADDVEIVCGQREPVQGWLAQGGKIIPSSTAVYHLEGDLPLTFGVLAAPYKSGVTSGLEVLPLERERESGDFPVLETTVVDELGGRFEILFADRPFEATCGGLEADAQGMVTRRGEGGQVVYVAGLNCRQLSYEDRALVTYEERKPLVEIELDIEEE